ncbi:DUF2961 domain-containing protein [Mucilaginibacter terrigena]|uniref:DUF2961 domain-containing protein n=1 Tax=Mucilaginibacter terrigena TaxID=2492395 RepID=A0A4Q5LRX9_9SPHI|nr:glycoside hydrolase family 172 protein [Mucilaginibacter terrigena]RYU92133.1 DUF2961 domain-containing protein [Mucilaginibacter terrigena]
MRFLYLILLIAAGNTCRAQVSNKALFEFDSNSVSRWSSPENINGVKGGGAKENFGAKGRPYLNLPAGKSVDLLNIKGQGIINRIWITINDRSPQMLRSLVIEMYWDNAAKPAVSVPLADFFGMGLGKMSTFQNTFFASPEGRSFNCVIPMPFRKGAHIRIKNDGTRELSNIFFDVNYQLTKVWNPNNLYFHAYWHRDTATVLAKDYELLPKVAGKGRLLGVNAGINANPKYGTTWWGEGEVKVYLDGDKQYPTLAGTGTEDYIGDAWSQSTFVNNFTGCLIADDKNKQWSFYRYHVPDPIYFTTDCRMTIQQMGSSFRKEVMDLQKNGAPMIPTSVDSGRGQTRNLYKTGVGFDDKSVTENFALYYRSDDWSSTAYFYLDKPSNNLPALQPLAIRTSNLKAAK